MLNHDGWEARPGHREKSRFAVSIYFFQHLPLMKTQKGTKKSANSCKTHFFYSSLQINVESGSGGTESNVYLIFCQSFTSWSIFVCVNLYRFFFICILNSHCQIHVLFINLYTVRSRHKLSFIVQVKKWYTA